MTDGFKDGEKGLAVVPEVREPDVRDPQRRMTTEDISTIISMSAAGKSLREIAAKIGFTYGAVQHRQSRPEMKALVEREFTELMNRGLRASRRTLTRLAAEGNNPKNRDMGMLKLSLDASKAIVSAASAGPGTIINTYIQQNNVNTEQSREIQELGAYLANKWGVESGRGGGEVIDAVEVPKEGEG